ncbi:aspartyl protease family protein [Roseateles sp. NT4]|uniref:aspartyl protease family protein n=1 Tax=Roseateles sp. NT4 TaxID=3453715 RepID=UPI003EEC597C
MRWRGKGASCGRRSHTAGRWWSRSPLAVVELLFAVHSAWAGCSLDKLEIPIRIVDHRPVGTLNLNGTDVSMLIDSGASYSFLTPSVAAQLNLRLRNLPDGVRLYGYTGAIEARRTRVEKVIFQGSTLNNVEFIVGGNELGSGIQGILGRNFLAMADTEYDLVHGVVRLMFPKGDCDKTNFAYWAGEAPVIVAPLDIDNRGQDTAIRVMAHINDKDTRALLDTGAPLTYINLPAAKRAGVNESDLAEQGRVGGVGKGRVNSWTVQIAAFELGGEKISNSKFRVGDVDARHEDMLIGLDWFLSHRVYVSRLQRKLYATWNGGQVFARGDATGEYDARYAAAPTEVAIDDADALARRGQAFAARGEYARALEDLDQACKLAPTSAENFLARARVHLATRQSVQAQTDLDEAIRLNPGLSDALVIRASLSAARGNRTVAQADLLSLDKALPPSSHLREQMARTYVTLGQVTEALRQWDMWVATHETDAEFARVLNSRCWLRTRHNIDLSLALEDCKSAVSQVRDEPAYRHNLGWTYLRLNDASRAIKAFDGAIEIKSMPTALYGRALAQHRQGNEEAARRDIEAARKQRRRIDEEVRKLGLPVSDDAPPAKDS